MAAPADVIARFVADVRKNLDYHRELLIAVTGKKRQAVLEGILCEQCVMAVAVQWEGFVTDLIVACVVADPSRCWEQLEERASQSIREKFGAEAEKHLVLTVPATTSKERALALIDPKRFNISHQSAEGLSKRANELLVGKFAIKFSLQQENSQFVDYLIALRNMLAHRSPASRAELRAAIEELSEAANVGLKGKTGVVGSYLRASVGNKETRTELICRRIGEVASLLA